MARRCTTRRNVRTDVCFCRQPPPHCPTCTKKLSVSNELLSFSLAREVPCLSLLDNGSTPNDPLRCSRWLSSISTTAVLACYPRQSRRSFVVPAATNALWAGHIEEENPTCGGAAPGTERAGKARIHPSSASLSETDTLHHKTPQDTHAGCICIHTSKQLQPTANTQQQQQQGKQQKQQQPTTTA